MHTVSTSDTAAGQRTKRPSDWTPVNYDLHDTWFPVSHSRDVTSRPIRRIIHSQPYFLWRENGIPQAAEFHPSRLAALRHASSAFTWTAIFRATRSGPSGSTPHRRSRWKTSST